MNQSKTLVLAGIIFTLAAATPALAGAGKAKALPKGVSAVAASKIPSGLKPGQDFSLGGKTVEFGGASGDGSYCICDPACTDGKYCDGCSGCKE